VTRNDQLRFSVAQAQRYLRGAYTSVDTAIASLTVIAKAIGTPPIGYRAAREARRKLQVATALVDTIAANINAVKPAKRRK
jgi:hypothetical protein